MEFFGLSNDAGFTERKTERARHRCVDPKDISRVKVESHPTLIVLFGDISPEERIVPILREDIARYIRYIIIRRLRPLL